MLLAIISSLVLSACSHKDQKDRKEKWNKLSFEESKELQIEMIRSRLTMLDNYQNCVKAANNKETLKDCRQKMKQTKKEMDQKLKKRLNK